MALKWRGQRDRRYQERTETGNYRGLLITLMPGAVLPTVEEASAVELVGYHNLAGRPAFKLAIQRQGDQWFLYTGHFWHSGWTVLDVTRPEAPKLLRFIPGPAGVRTAQIQVADGLMITGAEEPYDSDGRFDRDVLGFGVWDVKTDPTYPRLLGNHRTGGRGTHRNFYAGGSYVYATVAGIREFHGNILGIVDVSDPTAPVEVGRWWAPGQRIADGLAPVATMQLHGPAYVVGNRAYASWGRSGALILDVNDPIAPRLVAKVDVGDFHGLVGCHSAIPYRDGQLMVINGEGVYEGRDAAPQYLVVVDISDETNPRILSSCPVPRPSPGLPYRNYYEKGGRFGPHNQHHHQGHADHYRPRDVLPVTFFNAGLRLFTLSDPYMPEEVGCFVSGPPAERLGPRPHTALVSHFEDVLVDARGNIFCSDPNQGLFVLRSPLLE